MKINKNLTVSFDVDAQKGFTPLCPNELPIEGGDEIVDELNGNATKAKYRIHSKDAHALFPHWMAKKNMLQLTPITGQPDMDCHWNRHCVVGTKGFSLLDGLPHPRDYDFVIYKGAEPDMHPYSAIYQDHAKKISTGIIEWVESLKIRTFILGGLALNLNQDPMCLGATAIDLAKLGYEVIINLGATRSINVASDAEEQNKQFIQYLKVYGIVTINSFKEIE